jgi:hypothetical protein
MRYPVEHRQDWEKVGRPPIVQRLRIAWRNRTYYRRAPQRDGISLEHLAGPGSALAATEMVLLCVERNAERYLPSFLDHYRRLGVRRFAFLDDGSQDRTREMLAAAPDVDLFGSNVGFRQSAGGLVWRDMLVDRYGRGRWYVSVDSDEYLIYPGCETRPLEAFVADLEHHSRQRALAAMIDIYPDGPLSSLSPSSAALPPTATSPLLDGDGYAIADEKFCTAVRGGPRLRLFGTDMRLTKFPLVHADAATRFAGGTHHAPLPLDRNYSPVHALLLHHKFAAGAVADFRAIAERGSHAGGSAFYKAIVGHEAFHDATDFRYPGSRRYTGSEALLEQGYMQDLRDRRD